MHRMVATVFKILFFSLLFMFLLDTTLLVVSIVSIHSQVSNITAIMQTEIARNNCMPEEMAKGFNAYFESIVNRYNEVNQVYNSSDFISIKSNMSRTKLNADYTLTNDMVNTLVANVKNNSSFTGFLDEEDVQDYGKFTYLCVQVTLQPQYVFFSSKEPNGIANTLSRLGVMKMNLNYVYSVPCLRYLK